MKTNLSAPTKEQIKRWHYAQQVGCVACALDGKLAVPGDIHHALSGGRRISHWATVVLCEFHHRGVAPRPELGVKWNEEQYGPSLATSPKEFRQRYGTDAELVAIQNELIQQYKETTGDVL